MGSGRHRTHRASVCLLEALLRRRPRPVAPCNNGLYATTARPHPGPTTRPVAFTFVTHVSPVLGVDCIVTEGYDKYAATGADSDRLELQGLNDLSPQECSTDVDILGDR